MTLFTKPNYRSSQFHDFYLKKEKKERKCYSFYYLLQTEKLLTIDLKTNGRT